MKLVFCETKEHVLATERTEEIGGPDAQTVALTPEAAWACQEHGRSYLKLETFIHQADLSVHRDHVFRQAYQWMQWLDGYVDRLIPSLSGRGFSATTTHALVFQLLLDEFFAVSYALKALLEKHQRADVWYWPSPIASHHDILSDAVSLIPYLLPETAKACGVRLHPLIKATKALSRSEPNSHLKSWLQKHLTRMNLMGELSQIRYMGIKRYSQSRLKPSDPSLDPVWVLGCGYDIDLLVMALREQGTPIRWIQSLKGGRYLKPSINSKVRKELACQWGPLLRQEQFWAPLMQWGIGHNELFASVVRFWWDQELPEQCELYGLAETVLKKNHVKAVISWDTTSGPLASPIIQAAQKQGIPCIIYQHGSTFRIDGLWWYRWLIRADMLLVYGEGTAKHLRDTWPDSENPRARILAVGSARLDAISRSIHQNQTAALRSQLKGNDPRPLILYVPTPFGGVGRAFSDVAGYPNVSYFELQQQVLIIFSENPGVRLLYKDMITRNALYNPLSDFIQARIPNATVIRECALTKLFWAVDAIIVDHAITAMAEALLTTKPLLVYDPSGMSSIPEPPEARALLRKRAIVSGTHQDFLRDIRKFLQEGNFSDLASPNQECLAYYGTYLNDGHSADRAAREILKYSSHQTNHSCSL